MRNSSGLPGIRELPDGARQPNAYRELASEQLAEGLVTV